MKNGAFLVLGLSVAGCVQGVSKESVRSREEKGASEESREVRTVDEAAKVILASTPLPTAAHAFVERTAFHLRAAGLAEGTVSTLAAAGDDAVTPAPSLTLAFVRRYLGAATATITTAAVAMFDTARSLGPTVPTALGRAVGEALKDDPASLADVVRAVAGGHPEIMLAVPRLPKEESVAVLASAASAITAPESADAALRILKDEDASLALALNDELVAAGAYGKPDENGSGTHPASCLGVDDYLAAFEAQADPTGEGACPQLSTHKGVACGVENVGADLCKVGKTLFDSVLESVLAGDFGACPIIKAAYDMWVEKKTVDGVSYPGGFCLECAGSPHPVWTVFSINTCSGESYYGSSRPPCPASCSTPGVEPSAAAAYCEDKPLDHIFNIYEYWICTDDLGDHVVRNCTNPSCLHGTSASWSTFYGPGTGP